MLILKEKFLIIKIVVPFLLLAMAIAASQGAAAEARAARAPEVVAAEFYGWYLETMGADQDPLSDRYDTFTRYVAKDLAARLVDRLKAGRLPQRDYFIQAGNARPGWRGKVRAATMRRQGASAEVLVTLGEGQADGGPMQVLALSMVLENGSWKIRQVASLDARSSAEQSVI